MATAPASHEAFPLPSHPRFVVVTIGADGVERLALFAVTAVEAAKYVGGFVASQAAVGAWAEAREIDLSSIRLTGRTLDHAHVLKQAACFRQNDHLNGKAVNNNG